MMHKDFEAYLTKRIHELSNTKNKLVDLLQTANKPVNEIGYNREKEYSCNETGILSYIWCIGGIRGIKKDF